MVHLLRNALLRVITSAEFTADHRSEIDGYFADYWLLELLKLVGIFSLVLKLPQYAALYTCMHTKAIYACDH